MYESDWPILYLYRREHADSGGAGRFRSGNGGEIAYVMHGGESALGLYTTEGIPKTNGIFGGDPAAILRTRLIRGTDIQARFAAGELPQDIDALGGVDEQLANKGTGLPLSGDDVLYWNWSPAGGYGDPLTRDPDLVAADVTAGGITDAGAQRVYGVVIRDGAPVGQETDALRRRLLRERLQAAGAQITEPAADRTVPASAETVADVYVIDRQADRVECHRCGTRLCRLGESPKTGMAVLERPLTTLTPGAPDPREFVDDDVVWRDLLCPGCGVRLATEVAYPGAALFEEIRVY
jgi:N-methylhydantoinase B